MRALRVIGLVVALGAAVAVFVVGGRNGGTDWQVPALVLIGVLVLILHAATVPRPARTVAVAGAVAPAPAHHNAGPNHLAEPSAAEVRSVQAAGVPSALHLHAGMNDIVVPPSSFPDAGHGHGPVISIADDGPPPLHAVLASEMPGAVPGVVDAGVEPPALEQPAMEQSAMDQSAVSAESVPTAHMASPPPFTGPPPMHSGPVDATNGAGFDPLLVDLRPDTVDPMVMRVLPGEPPPAGSTRDVVAPGFEPGFEPGFDSGAEPPSPAGLV